MGTRGYDMRALAVLYALIAIIPTLLLLLGAAMIAAASGQRRWLYAFAAAVVIPLLLASAPIPALDIHSDAFAALLLIPQVTILSYSIARIVRPVAPALTHEPVTP